LKNFVSLEGLNPICFCLHNGTRSYRRQYGHRAYVHKNSDMGPVHSIAVVLNTASNTMRQ